MEEKSEFHYEANINFGKPPGREFKRILDISNLQPMAVRWEDVSGDIWLKVYHVDFYNEIVYDYAYKTGDYYPAPGPIAEEVLKIVQEKKAAAQQPIFPEGYVESVMQKALSAQKSAKDKREEARERTDARKT